MKFWFLLKESRRHCRCGFRHRAGSRASATKVTGSAVPEPVPSATFAFDLPAEPQHLATWIRSLVPTTRDRDARVAVVASLLAAVVASDLSRLDYEVRWQESWQTSSWWYLSVGEAEQLIGEATDTVTVAAGLSMHRDGHIREIAVRALGSSGDPRALRWLVLRCGDWVPEVRNAAFEGVDPWVTSAFAVLLVDVLPILDGERFDAERAAHTLRARVDAVLREPDCQAALDAGCLSADRATRRACARRLPPRAVDVELLQQVMATNDSVVFQWSLTRWGPCLLLPVG